MTDKTQYAYLIGGPSAPPSVSPVMHNHILRSLGHTNIQFHQKSCTTIDDAVALLRAPSFSGCALVTMPYKKVIMQHLDGLDELAVKLAACNLIYRAPDGSLRGSNTDWNGIKGSLVAADEGRKGAGKPALVVGAGGASRAVLNALFELECRVIYVLNRDEDEVRELFREMGTTYAGSGLQLIHVKSVPQAKQLSPPSYVVGAVPDFEPRTAEEINVRDMLEIFLSGAQEKGVLLDMCFKPLWTRTLKMGEKYGWQTADGVSVIRYQAPAQYSLWFGEEVVKKMDTAAIWQVLEKATEGMDQGLP